jgi:propanol-preferring alcohol dehydrogenase
MATETNGAAAPELPKTYKGAVYDEPGKISTKIVDLQMPEPGPGEILINLYVQRSRRALSPKQGVT